MAAVVFPKIGLALGSGGAKGLAHIGVIKTLEKNNIPIDFIAGSSIGSLIGAHYAAHKDVDKLEKLIFDFNRSKGFQLFDPAWKGGLVKGRKAERFIEEILEGATFDKMKIPYAAVATDINTAETVTFRQGDIVKAIRTSISVPAFFQPVFYDKRLLADGGLSNPVPVDVARAMGADIVIAVNLDNVYVEKALESLPALSTVPLHSINILRHNLAMHSASKADIVIAPKDVMQVGILGLNYLFSTEKAQTIIHAGEAAAEEHMPILQELLLLKQKERTRLGRVISFLKRVRKVKSI
jgi:NTE family protein